MNESPLGAAALAGTSFPVDRHATGSAGFDRPMRNSMDAVSDRDFAVEFLAAASLCAASVTPCRRTGALASIDLALSDSPMPFPRARQSCRRSAIPMRLSLSAPSRADERQPDHTPDRAEGLPLTYGKDMQEDKEPVFDAAENLLIALAATTG